MNVSAFLHIDLSLRSPPIALIVRTVLTPPMSQGPTLSSSQQLALICSAVTAVAMIAGRPVFRWRPETTFLGGLAGAILFFFLLILVGNIREKRGATELGWVFIGLCEFGALVVSVFVHPVCVTTCLLFSIPVVIYVKWAATQIKRGQGQVIRERPDAKPSAKKENRTPFPEPPNPTPKKTDRPPPDPPRQTGKKSARRVH
jgi:hypothetical protein